MAKFPNTLKQFKNFNANVDQLDWIPDKQGRVSVRRSAYWKFQRSDLQQGDWPWKMIWKVKVPFKIACFSWLLAKQAALTQDHLMKRGIQLCSRCLFCECEAETINHFFTL